MINIKDIYWVAALLEGEGSFGWNLNSKRNENRGVPVIQVSMSDRDVIDRVATLFCASIHIVNRKDRKNTMYHCSIWGRKAIGWMMTVYPIMGRRRQKRIKEVWRRWKAIPASPNWNRSRHIGWGKDIKRAE